MYVEELPPVVWMAPLLTQTQGLWVALSVLLHFNRLPGTRDENNFLLVYLRNSYSNYGNLSQTNFHIFSASSLIWIFSLCFTIPFHQPKYHIQTVWWMRRNTTKLKIIHLEWEFKNYQSPLYFFTIIKSSQHDVLLLHTREERNTTQSLVLSVRVKSSWKGTSLLIGTLTYFSQCPIFLSCLSDLYHTYSYILQHFSRAWKTHTIHVAR